MYGYYRTAAWRRHHLAHRRFKVSRHRPPSMLCIPRVPQLSFLLLYFYIKLSPWHCSRATRDSVCAPRERHSLTLYEWPVFGMEFHYKNGIWWWSQSPMLRVCWPPCHDWATSIHTRDKTNHCIASGTTATVASNIWAYAKQTHFIIIIFILSIDWWTTYI